MKPEEHPLGGPQNYRNAGEGVTFVPPVPTGKGVTREQALAIHTRRLKPTAGHKMIKLVGRDKKMYEKIGYTHFEEYPAGTGIKGRFWREADL